MGSFLDFMAGLAHLEAAVPPPPAQAHAPAPARPAPAPLPAVHPLDARSALQPAPDPNPPGTRPRRGRCPAQVQAPVKSEAERYLELPAVDMKTDLLKWWAENEINFPAGAERHGAPIPRRPRHVSLRRAPL